MNTPAMIARENHDALEKDFTSHRDALLHLTCATLERVGFRTSAWYDMVYESLYDLYEACATANLQPRYVIVRILIMVDQEDPPDTVEALLEFLSRIKDSIDGYRESGATILLV